VIDMAKRTIKAKGYKTGGNAEMRRLLGWSPRLNRFKYFRSEGAPLRTALKLSFGKSE